MFRAIKISDYDHVAEEKQFADICRLLEGRYGGSGESCLLLGNFNIEGVELDALLFLPGLIRILEFKNWSGNIVARENGPWTANSMVIAGGARGKTPFQQARANRSRVVQGLEHRTHVRHTHVSVAVIFRQACNIDCSQLSEHTGKWLMVCDNAHLEDILKGGGGVDIGNQEIEKMPKMLGIEGLSGNTSNDKGGSSPYESVGGAQDFFDDIGKAVDIVPDYQRVYRHYERVFHSLLNQNTELRGVMMQGALAKTDYLLKENGADIELIRAVNDLRVRIDRRAHGGMAEEVLEQCYFADMKALCHFVSLIYKVSIPAELAVMYSGKEAPHKERVLPKKDYIRVMVSGWDDTHIYGTSDDGDGVEKIKICYAKDTYENDYIDWTYLKDILYEGAMINVVAPVEKQDTIYASFIIFEPDYLVGVQTVASCFTEYADSPLVALINKLNPSANSDAKTLGKFAGQLLDKALREDTTNYKQCAKDFYKDNALELIGIENSKEFHNKARRQKTIIENVINVILPSLHKNFYKEKGMVEPSFFSEMLGLQGRMDFLQMDFRGTKDNDAGIFLMEQKSGKGGWPDDYPHTPKRKQEHYIQILLYMLIIRYNYHDIYRANKEELNAYLLYSQYEEPLIKVDFFPRKVQEAIRVRNEIASMEMRFAWDGGYDFLTELTADDLNEKHVGGKLWEQYLRPQIEDMLAPIREASELEKSYFLRFLTFVSMEHLLSKLGNNNKDCSGFAAAWHYSLEEKLVAGTIYVNLQLEKPEEDKHEDIKTLTFKYLDTEDNVMSNFRNGDIVVLYTYKPGNNPDLRKTMVFRSTIEHIGPDTITLRLNSPQNDEIAFDSRKDYLWAIEHDFRESTDNGLFKGLHALLKAPKERRDLVLLQRRPRVNAKARLNGDYGQFNNLVLRVKRSKDLFLIIGPPGTGKTSFGMLYNVKEELLSNPDSSILLLSYTNRAVDEICSKLGEEDIDYIRIGHEESCGEDYRDMLLSKIASETTKGVELFERILSTRVFVSTIASLNARLQILAMKTFSLCIIDEASQILEPHLMGIFAAKSDSGDKPAIEKFVLIGDQKQLPAVVQQDRKSSTVTEAILNDIFLTNCRDSLFERMLRKYGDNPSVTYMLSRQGRMHEEIAQFTSKYFYDNKLEAVSDRQKDVLPPLDGEVKDEMERMMLTKRVIFIEAHPPKESESMKVNEVEANIMAHAALLAYKHEKSTYGNETIGIIVPYRNQIATTRRAIEQLYKEEMGKDGNWLTEQDGDNLSSITIDTVERFQGSERKYIIYGFTIQRKYQLKFLTQSTFTDSNGKEVDRKLNVVLSRAKDYLIMVGNTKLLSLVSIYRELIDFVKANEGYMKLS